MARAACLAACVLSQASALGADAALDAVALVQHGSARAPSLVSHSPGGPLRMEPKGPVARTALGNIRGREEDDHLSFRGIPYCEPPPRFAKAAPKQPWQPETMQAMEYPPGCIGSGTQVPESEDCLHLNVWLPKGGHKGMPVIVYFHGGLNMHGSGAEPIRQGDGVTQSSKYPTVFVNFDYRLGILGWIYSENGESVPNNLGMHDQQMALRWVHDHISAFGGDPNQVTLMGQSEGAGNIMVHLVSPSSAGLFSRAIFHSPPAEVWSGKANEARTKAMVMKLGCWRASMADSLECLKKLPALDLWNADWTPEDLSRGIGSPKWFRAFFNAMSFAIGRKPDELATNLGWHTVVDGDILPGEVHDLIPQGRWNKVPVLITVSKNESLGTMPGDPTQPMIAEGLRSMVSMFAKSGEGDAVTRLYNESLARSGIAEPNPFFLRHQIITDKMWTCEAWNLAKEITEGGGTAQLGMFWHSPRFDSVGSLTNKLCMQGATCHAAEMLYSLPQGHGRGVPTFMREETAFVNRYRDEVLSFVHGHQGPWEVYRPERKVMTFYDESGPRPIENYRAEQCAVLDRSMSDALPLHMRRRAQGL